MTNYRRSNYRRYPMRRNRYFPNKLFKRAGGLRVIGEQFKTMVTYNLAKVGASSATRVFDPLYVMYNDARFATWRSMYDEYRIIKVVAKITPVQLTSNAISANAALSIVSSWDRNGTYAVDTDSSGAVSFDNVLALEASKYNTYSSGAEWTPIYMSLTRGSKEDMWLNTQYAPNTTSGSVSNIGPYFDPNLYLGVKTIVSNFTAVNDVTVIIEWKIFVEGRG